jgi:hypothetical protein
MSLNEIKLEHLQKLDAIELLIKKLESYKHEKRVYTLKTIINLMEISNLDESLLREKDFKIFDLLLHFSQSELQEERRLAVRGLARITLTLLQDRNPRISAVLDDSMQLNESIFKNQKPNLEDKVIKEENYKISESEMSQSHSSAKSSDSDSKSKSKDSKNLKNTSHISIEIRKKESSKDKIKDQNSGANSDSEDSSSSGSNSSNFSNSKHSSNIPYRK